MSNEEYAQKIVDKINYLTGKNIVEKKDLPTVMNELEDYIWELFEVEI